ncbi:uncharacterized protein TRIADDRAFT_37206 [Trichoplax adhaerens]|uniref:U5 small nuclear ribonucleoprotein 40 kDa protein n=1 Tax=Trichoplax adhaerens TaxID=10228 RepID=B3RP89_TRIAD|nr:hypothetical protein TRIADDRAFT_37206 [Trichoplax adhaerens]EDV27593.1 hypothetical protein TRIADDRAFT_37206 [Trichoplax adhaerens]|eukprot:XP_002109427.1 hypothetical protein TRIADDRAFT_37206 [Trichoplax adhaerens]
MLLTGHEGEIYTAKFHPDGEVLASASFERKIFLWNIYGECENYAILEGHKGAVLDLHFSTDGSQLFSASTDKTAAIWDFESGQRTKKFKGHTGIVNSCHPSRRGTQMLVTGSDDCTAKLWDVRRREPVHSFQSNYQVTAVSFNDTGDQIISGGLDNVIRVWDLRKNNIMYSMSGHLDTITSLSVSPDGCYVMSNAMDNSVRIWDIRPYVPGDRCLKIFTGAQHNFEKNLLKCSWSPDGKKIAAGSADRFVYVWDTATRRILYKLPGHDGSVNDVQFHPIEPIVMSCGSDKKIYLGELEL